MTRVSLGQKQQKKTVERHGVGVYLTARKDDPGVH